LIILRIIFFYCFLVALDNNYLYSITKTQKKPYNQGFSLLIHTKLSRLLRQRYTLGGSDLPYHFVGAPTLSTSPIACAEDLLLLR